jgi:phage terminase large subunit-like protein
MPERAPNVSSADLPPCGFTLDDLTCTEQGDHFCEPRARHAASFFREILVHTKGVWARRKFDLRPWQDAEIIRPIFGPVRWSDEFDRYVRVIRIVWIELARKQGKSEVLAGIALYLLVADGEDGAEIYGAAMDRDQARKVFDVAARMVQLSPVLSKRLRVKAHEKRIVDEKTGSYYEVIAADAAGNPRAQPARHRLRRGADAEERRPVGLAAYRDGHPRAAADGGRDYARRRPGVVVRPDARRDGEGRGRPERAPHQYVYLRNTPPNADPWDESNWGHANPALGEFLSLSALRDEALEAKNDPSKENSFRQFRLAQWVRQSVRWMPMHLWDACVRRAVANPRLAPRRPCWQDGVVRVRPCGEVRPHRLGAGRSRTATSCTCCGGSGCRRTRCPTWTSTRRPVHPWAQQGWLTVTEGNVVDYDRIYADIKRTHATSHCAPATATSGRWPR